MQENGVAIPVLPAYVTVPLSALIFSTASATGTLYALVISVSAEVNWHSVVSNATLGLPRSGAADVNGSWVRKRSIMQFQCLLGPENSRLTMLHISACSLCRPPQTADPHGYHGFPTAAFVSTALN